MITVLVWASLTTPATESMWQLQVRVYVSLIDEDSCLQIEAYAESQDEALGDVDLIDCRVALFMVCKSLNCINCEQKSISQALTRIVNHVVLNLIPRTDFLKSNGKSVAKTAFVTAV